MPQVVHCLPFALRCGHGVSEVRAQEQDRAGALAPRRSHLLVSSAMQRSTRLSQELYERLTWIFCRESCRQFSGLVGQTPEGSLENYLRGDVAGPPWRQPD
jgi:hypothetical protein